LMVLMVFYAAMIFAEPLSNDQRHFGLVDPVFTPFTEDGVVNTAVIDEYANWTHSMSTDTVILGGSTGEWPSLSSDERLAALRAWRKALDKLPARPAPMRPRPRLLFHSGDVNVQRAQDLTRAAASAGADAVLIVAPCIMKPASLDMLVEVIGLIANETALPAFYYHYPALYQVNFSMTDFLQNAVRMPTLAGVKYIDDIHSPELRTIAQMDGGRFEIFAASTSNVTFALDIGIGGLIGYTAFGVYIAKLNQAWKTGDTATVSAMQTTMGKLTASLKAGGSTKTAARYSSRLFIGTDLGPPRVPLTGLNSVQFQNMEDALQANGFLN